VGRGGDKLGPAPQPSLCPRRAACSAWHPRSRSRRNALGVPAVPVVVRDVDAAVIGAGQAGLSVAYHLVRGGLVPGRDLVVLDANPGPGGAWRHRWPSLTLGATHRIADLPGMPLGSPDPARPASEVVADYYGAFEERFGLHVRRRVHVLSVSSPDGPDGSLEVETDAGTWRSSTLAVRPAPGTVRTGPTTLAARPSVGGSCTPTTSAARTSSAASTSSWSVAGHRRSSSCCSSTLLALRRPG